MCHWCSHTARWMSSRKYLDGSHIKSVPICCFPVAYQSQHVRKQTKTQEISAALNVRFIESGSFGETRYVCKGQSLIKDNSVIYVFKTSKVHSPQIQCFAVIYCIYGKKTSLYWQKTLDLTPIVRHLIAPSWVARHKFPSVASYVPYRLGKIGFFQ